MTIVATSAPIGALYMLRIEVDGHRHGGPPIKPWAARITGPDAQYGLAREFVRPMNDWREASRSWRGHVYGMVATFPLREGALYEVARARGKPSKRHLAREFWWVDRGKMHRRSAEEALAIADGDDRPPLTLRLAESDDHPAYVARVEGLGTPKPKAFVLDGAVRIYHLHEGDLYEVRGTTPSSRRRSGHAHGPFVAVDGGKLIDLGREEALEWLRR